MSRFFTCNQRGAGGGRCQVIKLAGNGSEVESIREPFWRLFTRGPHAGLWSLADSLDGRGGKLPANGRKRGTLPPPAVRLCVGAEGGGEVGGVVVTVKRCFGRIGPPPRIVASCSLAHLIVRLLLAAQSLPSACDCNQARSPHARRRLGSFHTRGCRDYVDVHSLVGLSS